MSKDVGNVVIVAFLPFARVEVPFFLNLGFEVSEIDSGLYN